MLDCSQLETTEAAGEAATGEVWRDRQGSPRECRPEGKSLAVAPTRSRELSDILARIDLDRLTTLTLEVALCAREGDSNRRIASFLGISPSTVARHLAKARGL